MIFIKYKKSILVLLIVIVLITFLFVYSSNVIATENKEMQYIYLDPGHGGKDGGAISNNEIYEKNINLLICYYLKAYLENSGYNVKMTRYGDYDLASPESKKRKLEDINKRIELIDNDNVILFVSIHCNTYSSNKIRGSQTFYKNNNDNKKLANSIQEKLKNILKNTDRNSKSITGKYLIDNSNNIGCLVEVGFLSNSEELNLLTTTKYQDLVAYCIYLGIIEYLGV